MLDLDPTHYIQIGDVVVLNSGGPAMLVYKNNGIVVKCTWPGNKGKLQKAEFPYASVTKQQIIPQGNK